MAFGAPTVTGYSGFFDPNFARPGNGAEVNYNGVPRYGRSSVERLLSHALQKGGFRGMRRVMRALNGAAPGSAANESYTRVGTVEQGINLSPGGLRTMETLVMNSGNTTGAQQTYLQNRIIDALFITSPTVPYPADLSGNGSGGKLGI